ncbi:MAG: DMT family transporter [Pseudomonadota bacterium]
MTRTPSQVPQSPAQAAHPAAAPVRLKAISGQYSVRKAMGSVLIAIAILTLMDAGIKFWAESFGTPQILVMRYGAGALVGGVILLGLALAGHGQRISRGSVKRAVQRSLLIWFVAGLFFYSLSVIPLAEATAIAFTAPIYTALLGWVILREPVNARTWLAILIGLFGVLIISLGSLDTDGAQPGALSGYIAAAVSCVFYAAAMVLTRLHAATDPVPQMVFLQAGFSCLFSMPLLLLTLAGAPIDGRPFLFPSEQMLWLGLAIGVLGTIGHLFMAWGFKHAPAAKLGPMEYTGLLWAAAYGFIFFSEIPSLRLMAGCFFIVLGTWIVMRGERDGG